MPYINDRCRNEVKKFTCPGCYYDHTDPVNECCSCGAKLSCYAAPVMHYFCELVEDEELPDLVPVEEK